MNKTLEQRRIKLEDFMNHTTFLHILYIKRLFCQDLANTR